MELRTLLNLPNISTSDILKQPPRLTHRRRKEALSHPMYSHATQRLSVGLLLCAAAVHGFTATLRGGNGRVQSSACSIVALRLARPSRDGNDDGIRKAGGAEAGKKESAPADKMFSSFDAFRGKAIKETEAAERAFLRFDEFLKTDEEKKNGSRQ